MPRVNTATATALITSRLPFTTNGALAAAYRGLDYVVTSYTNAIAVVMPDGNVWINDALYSETTSNHQHLTRDALRREMPIWGCTVTITDPADFADVTGHHARLRTI